MGSGLMSVIQKMLSSGQGGMAQGGTDMFGANGNGKIMPQGSAMEGFDKGIMDGMAFGGGQTGVKHAMNTKEADYQLGMSPLSQYQDMSQPSYGGMNQFMQFANTARPAQSQAQPVQPNQYVQFLLSGMRGGR